MTAPEVVRLVVVAACGVAVTAVGALLWSRPDLVLRGARAAPAPHPHRASGTVRRLGVAVACAGLAIAAAGVASGVAG